MATDPAAAIRALWRRPPANRRGPQRAFEVEHVLDRAIDLADAHGLDAVTMRRLATELGLTPMALYTYVPDKGVLVEMMLDRLYQRSARPERRRPGSLPDAVESIVRASYALHRRHPWAANLATVRPALGPGSLAKYEAELQLLDGHGLDDLAMDDVLTLATTFSQAAARNAVAADTVRSESGMTDEQWWQVAGPELAQVVDSGDYPLATRVGSAAGDARRTAHDPDAAFEFGLARLLAGIVDLVRE